MNLSINRKYMLGAVFMIAASVFAQEQQLTLRQCLEKGLENNYSLRIVRNEQQMADNNANRANAGQLPTVSASAGYSGSHSSRSVVSGFSKIVFVCPMENRLSIAYLRIYSVSQTFGIVSNWLVDAADRITAKRVHYAIRCDSCD